MGIGEIIFLHNFWLTLKMFAIFKIQLPKLFQKFKRIKNLNRFDECSNNFFCTHFPKHPVKKNLWRHIQNLVSKLIKFCG